MGTIDDPLAAVLGPDPGPFALLHRSGDGPPTVEILRGPIREVALLDDVGVEEAGGPSEQLVLIPYRQVAERAFACVDDGTPLLVMTVTERSAISVDEACQRIPYGEMHITEHGFDRDDEAYAEVVRTIVASEIGRGKGANFVLKRTHHSTAQAYAPSQAVTLFKRLLQGETGACWVFAVHTGDRTLIGATPERHLVLSGQRLAMNPISGTYRYPSAGPTLDGVLGFLQDGKESEELFMVVDEELKMMARLCESDVKLVGPRLREMARLAHTEYVIEGITSRPVSELLRETMFAPTVVGSPLESACRVVQRYEPEGRGYYAGVLALVDRSIEGDVTLDSAILIRCADIDRDGGIRISVGATIVRQSDPMSEAKETEAKARGLLDALRTKRVARYGDHPEVSCLLTSRNEGVASFWCEGGSRPQAAADALRFRRALVVDAEDNFSFMLKHQLTALGLDVTLRAHDDVGDLDAYDLVVMGPGPGDPEDLSDPRIARLHQLIAWLVDVRRPMLAICLSHQVLCSQIGLRLQRRTAPNQGTPKTIDLFGRSATVGFYNTFSARSEAFLLDDPRLGVVELSRDASTDEVHALRGAFFRSFQFHPESVLSTDGMGILHNELAGLLRRKRALRLPTGRAASLETIP